MDRRKIAELRILLVKDAVGGEQESCDLSDAIYPHVGELLALADTTLKIRQEYGKFEKRDLTLPRGMARLSATVVSAMRDLDDLEGTAKIVQGFVPVGADQQLRKGG